MAIARGTESPMDFEYQNKNGPVDPKSPFLAHQKQFGGQPGFGSPVRSSRPFESATTRFAFNMNTPSQTPQAPPFRNPSFTTPRQAFDEDLPSEASGAEHSPADNADAEDTPELPQLKNMNLFEGNPRHRQPVFGRGGKNFIGTSPGRSDFQRGRYATATISQKTRKRRRIERDSGLGRRDSNSSDDSGDSSRSGTARRKGNEPAKSWFAHFIDGIVDRPTLPYILSYYPQLILNYVLVFGALYTIWIFFRAIRSDVDAASEVVYSAILAEMSECNQHFLDNRCGDGNRLPAVRKLCDAWDLCMNRDPKQVGRARVSARTFAEIFNSFVEPISWKAMAFCTIFFLVCITVNNMAFGLYRSKASHPPPAPYNPPEYHWGPIPHSSPQRDQHLLGREDDSQSSAIMPSAARSRSRNPTKRFGGALLKRS